ncbi:MAG: uracil-DNA glycosylase [Thermodesulfovibrionales bacterium]|nr:uracil-DNA glycosylase [Thermodesulfovibrionales bacterium]
MHSKENDLKLLLNYYKALGFQELIINEGFEIYDTTLTSTDFKETDLPPRVEETHSLTSISESIKGCCRCKLYSTRTNIVFGEGSERAELMFVGEGPGADEDLQGKPFVGKAGQLLTNLILKLGLTREVVYIANIVKCRPPNNRDPDTDEINACIGFLKEQIKAIKPKVIVSLGKVATHSLLNIAEPISKFSIMKERGKFREYIDGELKIPLMPTYHPSYLLRNREAKWDVWADMQIVMKTLKDG